jgi:hypothetical protein
MPRDEVNASLPLVVGRTAQNLARGLSCHTPTVNFGNLSILLNPFHLWGAQHTERALPVLVQVLVHPFQTPAVGSELHLVPPKSLSARTSAPQLRCRLAAMQGCSETTRITIPPRSSHKFSALETRYRRSDASAGEMVEICWCFLVSSGRTRKRRPLTLPSLATLPAQLCKP